MGKFVDLTGQRFGRLLITSRADNYKYASKTHGRVIQFAQFNCLCDCGEVVTHMAQDIKKGKVVSCGCHKEDVGRAQLTIHGLSHLRQYDTWYNMTVRCKDKSNLLYGGRGITFDPKWETFEGFWEDMAEGYADNLELERKDSNGNYCKDNCCWVNRSMQSFNRRKLESNTSGRTGVRYYKPSDKWSARIGFNNKEVFLGYYQTFEEAVEARRAAELNYFGRTLDDYQ